MVQVFADYWNKKFVNSIALASSKNKSSHRQVFFTKKCLAECKVAWKCGVKNDPDIQTQNMSFSIKYLLREHKSFALYGLSTGTSQITNNFSLIFVDLFTEKLFYESRFSDWHCYWMIKKGRQI